MSELVIASGTGSILLQVALSGREKFTIGRGDRCDVRLKGANVARLHAVLFEELGRWHLLDATVGNDRGLWLGAQRVRICTLREEEPVRMGDVFCWFFGSPGAPVPSLPAVPTTDRGLAILREDYIAGLWRNGVLRADTPEHPPSTTRNGSTRAETGSAWRH